MVQDRNAAQNHSRGCGRTPLDIIAGSPPHAIYQRKRAGTVGILNDFERRLEGAVEGVFARVFRTGLHPVELATQILKEMETHKTVGVRNVWVPNHFVFRLSETDAERFRDTKKALKNELEHVVLDGARERGWGLVGPPTVELEPDPDVKEGRFECEASLVEGPTGWTQAVDAGAPSAGGSVAAPSGRGLLTIVGDGGGGRTYGLEKDRVTIGRLPECDVVLSDPGASRQHAEIRRVGGAFVVVDLGSTNTTLVNGAPIAEHGLADGDRITIGNTVLEFRRG
jgi:FhaA, N-terminal domain/FHA domain